MLSSGFGALRIGVITIAAVAAVGLSACAAGHPETDAMERVTEEAVEEPDEGEESAPVGEAANGTASEEAEMPEETAPIDEALEQYRIIISQADSYEYGEYAKADQSWLTLAGYQYTLVQMQADASAPALLLGREIMDTELSVSNRYIRVFQYDPDTKKVRQPADVITDGGIRGGLSIAGDGYGIFTQNWSGGAGEGSVERITLDGDSLNRETHWSGQIFEMPGSITFMEMEWHESENLSALDSWTVPDTDGAVSAEPDDGAQPADGDRIVLTGTVGTYDYDGIIALQGQPDPNGFDEVSVSYARAQSYFVLVLDTPQTFCFPSGDGSGDYYEHEALMFSLKYVEGMEQYEGQHITFSVDPARCSWPSDTSLPLGQPFTHDIHVLE